MSYTKLDPPPPPDASEALTLALQQNGVDPSIAQTMLSSAALVQLETGEKVWVSCVADDQPDTPQLDFLTVALALNEAGDAIWLKPNGQPVGRVFWQGIWPEQLATLTIDVVRKACMMLALGEPQPQVDIPNPEEGGPTQQDALPVGDVAGSFSVRTAIAAARELAAPLADVL
jgi:hypothetical protein